MIYKRVNDKPRFVPENYKTIYNKKCIPEDIEYDVEMQHHGTGIEPENHPLKNHIYFHPCGNCNSENIKVIYAHWCVSTHSGDAYWDYEAYCEDCQKFTVCSYSEND
ncbi:MAG: hypothetical protein FK731_07280 [Asgard group archaeon]|nr:hypothetical protein [Asgard group archaeon]